jgi:Peptidase A4 family
MTRWFRFRPAALVTAGLVLGVGFAGSTGIASASTHHARAAVLQPGGPLIRARTSGAEPYPVTSFNWSGYAATVGKDKSFDDVQSSFVQPRITCTGKFTYTSNWVGFDGFENQTVEQDGTAAYCGGGHSHMTPLYYAWVEMYPKPSVEVFKVSPGDYISSSVTYSGGKFHLSIADATSGKHATTSAACSTCARASAEWIIERPASCNKAQTKCEIDRLADFHTTAMNDDWASLTGGSLKGPGGFTNYPIDMVSMLPHNRPGFISTDEVSALSGASFSAVWNRSGIPLPFTP